MSPSTNRQQECNIGEMDNRTKNIISDAVKKEAAGILENINKVRGWKVDELSNLIKPVLQLFKPGSGVMTL
jgi:hypothetical protein